MKILLKWQPAVLRFAVYIHSCCVSQSSVQIHTHWGKTVRWLCKISLVFFILLNETNSHFVSQCAGEIHTNGRRLTQMPVQNLLSFQPLCFAISGRLTGHSASKRALPRGCHLFRDFSSAVGNLAQNSFRVCQKKAWLGILQLLCNWNHRQIFSIFKSSCGCSSRESVSQQGNHTWWIFVGSVTACWWPGMRPFEKRTILLLFCQRKFLLEG